jgi:hypothetical protein
VATVEVSGAANLARTLKEAGIGLGSLKEANAYAAQIAGAWVAGRAPRVTGNLASSVRGRVRQTGASVVSGGSFAPYAGPINFGWPKRGIEANNFLYEGVRASETEWVARYEVEIQKVCDHVRGV